MINFKLKDIDKIDPVGQEPDLYLSWFCLTDGELWLTFGKHTIYQYTKEAIQHFGNNPTPYSDYYIVRFLEDFTEIFEKIIITIPNEFYKLTKDLKQFRDDAQKWRNIHVNDKNENKDFFFEEYDKLISWVYGRRLDSAHLIGGPHLSFFRQNEKIRIVWNTEHALVNGISLWTAKDGSREMVFSDFVNEVKIFGRKFFQEMDKQIELVLAKEWGDINLDKKRLIEEHKERKLEFENNLAFLEEGTKVETNWNEIVALYKRMTNDIK